MQLFPTAKPPVGIIFDSAMGNRIDDALALALLYGLDGKNEARVVSISVSRNNIASAAYCETVGKFYAGAVNGGFNSVGRTLPVGMALPSSKRKLDEDTPMLTVPLSKTKPDGSPVYNAGIHRLNDTAEVPALIRNACTSQHDQNAIVVLTGPATNLVSVLDLAGAKEVIAAKVRFLSIAADDFNIKADPAAAKRLFAEWPTPIFATGNDIGAALLYPAASIEKDFEWAPNHPVVDAYRAYRPMPYDAPTWAMAPVLYAIRQKEGYFKVSDSGTFTVTNDGRLDFAHSPAGKHHRVLLDPDQQARVLKTYTEITCLKPVIRAPRFPKPKQVELDPAKPAAQ
jgi:inosine-uridine nucleoside N-ribohydrolase